MSKFNIHYLADHPEHIQACAAWAYGRWGVQKSHGSLERSLKHFEQAMHKDKLPIALVAINNDTKLPVAMGCLVEQDGKEWTHCTPWIAKFLILRRRVKLRF